MSLPDHLQEYKDAVENYNKRDKPVVVKPPPTIPTVELPPTRARKLRDWFIWFLFYLLLYLGGAYVFSRLYQTINITINFG